MRCSQSSSPFWCSTSSRRNRRISQPCCPCGRRRWSYAVSYLFVAIVWVNHHHVWRYADRATPGLIWGNFAHLFTVSLMPFSTAWIAGTELAAVPVAIYAGVFVLVNATYLALCFEVVDRPRSAGVPPRARMMMRMRSLATLAIFAAAALVALKYPAGGMALICLCLMVYLRPEARGVITWSRGSPASGQCRAGARRVGDGSSWNDVIGPLLSKGLDVLAAPIPLTSLSDDIAALDRALDRIDGPVVLVAPRLCRRGDRRDEQREDPNTGLHRSSGAGRRRDSRRVFYRAPSHPQAPQLAPDTHGLIWMPHEGFATAFSQHASARAGCTVCGDTAADRRRVHPGKIYKTCVEGAAVLVLRGRGRPDDQSGDPALYGATHGRTHPTEKVDHTPLVSAPRSVIEVVLEAVADLGTR